MGSGEVKQEGEKQKGKRGEVERNGEVGGEGGRGDRGRWGRGE